MPKLNTCHISIFHSFQDLGPTTDAPPLPPAPQRAARSRSGAAGAAGGTAADSGGFAGASAKRSPADGDLQCLRTEFCR